MFFSRREANATHLISGLPNSGCGLEFEKAFTTFDDNLRESMSHHRIVTYNLGDLKCMVRFEVDAYIGNGDSESTTPPRMSHDNKVEEASPIPSPTEPIGIVPSTTSPEGKSDNSLQVINRGRTVPDSSVAEIKCRKHSYPNSNYTFRPLWPQLWISQTKNVMVGYHTDGKITVSIPVQDVTDELEKWEIENNQRLRNMIQVIKTAKQFAMNVKGGKCMLIYEKGQQNLKLYERREGDFVLPEGVEERGWRSQGSQ